MRIDEFEFQDRNGNEIEPTKNQLVVYIKSLHKQIAELQKQLKSQPAEIVEEIKQTVKNNLVYPDNRIDCPFNDGYLDEETLCSIMDKVLQEYQKGEN